MSDDSINVKLVGGLGNQLFIWATGYAISKRRNLDLVIDASECTQRGYELDLFGIEAAIKPLNPPDGILPTRFPNSKSRWIKQFHKWRNVWRYLRLGNNFWERPGGFDPTVFEVPTNKILRGYFQSYKYFEDTLEEIQQLLLANIKMSKQYYQLLNRLKGEQWVAIHLRHGDYEAMKDTFGVIGQSYYQESIAHIESYLPGVKKYVFSDDIPKSKVILPGFDGYIGINELPNSAERLLLSSSAAALIGSNSSFSLWAGFLSRAENHLKIFPEPWFLDQSLKTDSLIPPNWARISSSFN